MGGVFRFLTAGESHGEALTAVIDGVPAGLALAEADIDADLARRQRGYGRGGRMKIERDQVHILSGVRWGRTLGSPITLQIRNRDWENWKETMSVAPPPPGAAAKEVTRPRPGHADLAGALKYGHRDLRNVLERASAREPAARVAVGAVVKRLIGEVAFDPAGLDPAEEHRRAEASELRCPDEGATARMRARIDEAKRQGDSV